MHPADPAAWSRLSKDQRVRHRAWWELGLLVDTLEKRGQDDVVKEIDRIRTYLYVPGKHNEFVLGKEDE
jgi:hypothetical protein